jgi:hypothetical protein
MEELLELRTLLLGGNISEALLLVEEMTEMSKDDKLNKIFSFSIILLIHLIKQQAEKKSTKSWETSIFNTVKQIQRSNKRRKSGGYYLTQAELRETIEDAYESGLKQAALEVFEGRYESAELEILVDREKVIQEAITLVSG